jgi:sarcosine oxidase subunit alpha
MQTRRLPRGGRIDREAPLTFSFNGRAYTGFAGDTLASALLANGIGVLARSFKYHRPRGVVGSGAEEPNALLQVGRGGLTLPNQRATQVELYDGLVAESVNCWPSPQFDVAAVTGLFAKLLPAGFYYKTFMWPQRWWDTYERFIRRAAGLGYCPRAPDPDYYEKTNATCDVLVVGAGPAGIAAALAAGRSGARVVLADEQSELGGSLLYRDAQIGSDSGSAWLQNSLAALRDMPEVTLLPRTTVFGYYSHNWLGMLERVTDHLPAGDSTKPRQRLWRVRARQVILATGAIERPLVFCNNDRPGVMLASAVSTYVKRYAVRPGTRAVVFTNNDSAYQTALDLQQAGVAVVAVVDARDNPQGPIIDAVNAQQGIESICGAVVHDVLGRKHVHGVRVAPLDAADAALSGHTRTLDCDLLAVSGGWNPTVHLHAQSGARATFNEQRGCFLPGQSVQAERSVGACSGEFALKPSLDGGAAAGADAARAAGFKPGRKRTYKVAATEHGAARLVWRVPARTRVSRAPKQFVDLQNDTTAADLELAVREGFRSIEHIKRYTALGFGTDQGKLGNINGMAIVAAALGENPGGPGTTTFRPAYTPVTFGAIVGRELGDRFAPIRKTAMHPWHEAHGAEFEDVGQWKRPWFYPRPGEDMQRAVNRECRAARNGVAIMDASTLGKIDVRGPDAAEFLNRIYTNGWSKLAVGRCRYGLMLGEDGMVMDDGVSARLGEDRFYMTTTTGGAAGVLAWMERWLQTEWPHLKVHFTSVTDQWATIGIVGPKSREVLGKLCPDVDFDRDSFPFMSFREGTVAGVGARVFRISFSGELAYEINVPANYGQGVWEAAMAAGEAFDITPYGTEAMHVLRAEKGFIIVGQDTDGSMTPVDLGMDWILSKHKDFIGRRSLARSDCVRADRKQLVGLLTEQPEQVLPEGAQLVDDAGVARPVPMIGHVTSSYFSDCLQRYIALAVVKGGHQRTGDTVQAPLNDGSVVQATIVSPVFYDPDGVRQHA